MQTHTSKRLCDHMYMSIPLVCTSSFHDIVVLLLSWRDTSLTVEILFHNQERHKLIGPHIVSANIKLRHWEIGKHHLMGAHIQKINSNNSTTIIVLNQEECWFDSDSLNCSRNMSCADGKPPSVLLTIKWLFIDAVGTSSFYYFVA
jgi:hypothetical protein